MRGTVLGFDSLTGSGVISGEDGARYRFVGAQWKSQGLPQAQDVVDFEASEEGAAQIYLLSRGGRAPPAPSAMGAMGAAMAPAAAPFDASKVIALGLFLGLLAAYVIGNYALWFRFGSLASSFIRGGNSEVMIVQLVFTGIGVAVLIPVILAGIAGLQGLSGKRNRGLEITAGILGVLLTIAGWALYVAATVVDENFNRSWDMAGMIGFRPGGFGFDAGSILYGVMSVLLIIGFNRRPQAV